MLATNQWQAPHQHYQLTSSTRKNLNPRTRKLENGVMHHPLRTDREKCPHRSNTLGNFSSRPRHTSTVWSPLSAFRCTPRPLERPLSDAPRECRVHSQLLIPSSAQSGSSLRLFRPRFSQRAHPEHHVPEGAGDSPTRDSPRLRVSPRRSLEHNPTHTCTHSKLQKRYPRKKQLCNSRQPPAGIHWRDLVPVTQEEA